MENKVVLQDGYWVDEFNNKWDVNKYDEKTASYNSMTLHTCNNCLNCSHCSKASYCINSDFLTECKHCENSYNLIECERCENCKFCYKCSESQNLTNATFLHDAHNQYYSDKPLCFVS